MNPQLAVPTLGDLQRMARELKQLIKKPAEKLSSETFYTLTYLSAIVVDDVANTTPFHE